jgi:PhoPQ-activated pathogenicity-related protein
MKTVACLCVASVGLAFFSVPGFAAEPAGLEVTALDRYVAAPDSHYEYSVANTIEGDGYTTYIVNMTSQKWLTEKEVNLPIWKHVMTVTKPDVIESDIGFLYITGRSNAEKDMTRDAAPALDIVMAKTTGTVITTLYQVPNQPLVFVGDETRRRSEDASIAYTWDKYMRTGDEKWPLRLPMTKSAVRAMDTVTNLMATEAAGGHEVDQFVVAGGSKRGWTTWTTAVVDNRVVAIMPIVIDMLNVVESFKHHYEVYGGYATAVGDYTMMGIMKWMGSPEFDALMDIVEPFEYRDRLKLPKYLLNSTGDQFFLPDSWQFYWDGLVGEKHVRYVPNSDHGMGDTDVQESIVAWYHGIVHNVSTPRYTWDVAEDGTITVLTLDEPTNVLLWQAHSPETRNFMKDIIGPAYTSTQLQQVEPGKYVAKVEPPSQGFISYYVEMEYPSGTDVPFKFSTGTKIVPDVVNHKWKAAKKKDRLKEPVHR